MNSATITEINPDTSGRRYFHATGTFNGQPFEIDSLPEAYIGMGAPTEAAVFAAVEAIASMKALHEGLPGETVDQQLARILKA